jgi:glutaredoxin
MTQLKLFSLEGCYYSESAEELLNSNNVKYSLQKVKQADKQSIKDMNGMNTFPQVFLETSDNKLKIGGYSELNNICNIVNNKGNLDDTIDSVSKNLYTFKDDKKNVLRLINILLKT